MSKWQDVPKEEIEIDGEDINICLEGDKFGNNYCVVKKADMLELLSPEWISVKDRLPEVPDGADAVKVLVYYECPITHELDIVTTYFWRDSILLNGEDASGFEFEGVTHWMYAPPPPVKEQEV